MESTSQKLAKYHGVSGASSLTPPVSRLPLLEHEQPTTYIPHDMHGILSTVPGTLSGAQKLGSHY